MSRLLGYTFISKSWRRSEEGKGERLIFYLLVHSPMNVTRAGLGWTKSWELHPGLPNWWQGLKFLVSPLVSLAQKQRVGLQVNN